MLICDIYTLQTIYTLYFTKHVILYGTDTLDLQQIVRVYTTFGQFITGLQYLAVDNLDTGTVRNQICLGFTSLFVGNYHFTLLLGITDLSLAAKFSNDCKSLRLSGLEQLLDTGKTLSDIVTCDTTTVEGSHGQLGTGLTDRLCSDDTNCFTYLYGFTGCHVGTVTFCTDTNV